MSLDALKAAGIKVLRNEKTINTYHINKASGSFGHIIAFIPRELRIIKLRKEIKNLKVEDDLTWHKEHIEFSVWKEYQYPENEIQNVYKYGFASKRRLVMIVRRLRKGEELPDNELREVPLTNWRKDPNWTS